MNFAERILGELDRRLQTPIELTLYGRAAFLLGFDDPPEQFSQSLDVDVVLWLGQAEDLEMKTNFWEALTETNEFLAPDGLYVSHLFVEDQVILTPSWKEKRFPISKAWPKLDLFRLSDQDLLLSKLMRDDPQDRQDALFIITRRKWTVRDLQAILAEARLPEIAEIREQFAIASGKVLQGLG